MPLQVRPTEVNLEKYEVPQLQMKRLIQLELKGEGAAVFEPQAFVEAYASSLKLDVSRVSLDSVVDSLLSRKRKTVQLAVEAEAVTTQPASGAHLIQQPSYSRH